MTTPPPNWYADPQDATALRWWDGTQWTAHVRAGVQQSTGYAGTPVPTKGHNPIASGPTPHMGAAAASTPTSYGASANAGGVFAPGGNSPLRGGTGGRHVWQWVLGLVALLALLGGAAWAVIAMTRVEDTGTPSAVVPSDRPAATSGTPEPSPSVPQASGEATVAPTAGPTGAPGEIVPWTARGDNATWDIPAEWRDLTPDALAFYVEEEDFQSAEDLGGAWAADGRSWELSVNYAFAWVYEGFSPDIPMEDLAAEFLEYYNSDLTEMEVTDEVYFTTAQGYEAWRADVTGRWDGDPASRRLIIVRDGVSTEMYFTLDATKQFDERAAALLAVAESAKVVETP